MKQPWPSVTQVLGVFSDFSKIRPDVLARACQRGTAVHGYCESIARGFFPGEVPADLAGYVESFRKWFSLVDEVLLIEERLFDQTFQFRGKPDFVVRLQGDADPRLIDLKTPISVGRTWAAQIAAYEHLFELKTGLKCRHSGTLRLKKDGRMPLFDEYRNSKGDLSAFFGALHAYIYFKED